MTEHWSSGMRSLRHCDGFVKWASQFESWEAAWKHSETSGWLAAVLDEFDAWQGNRDEYSSLEASAWGEDWQYNSSIEAVCEGRCCSKLRELFPTAPRLEESDD